uniref:Uncharacterized protein n=1 Tax=Pararge aegeria TaxID=116150 RepID=S4PAU8_9NEOP
MIYLIDSVEKATTCGNTNNCGFPILLLDGVLSTLYKSESSIRRRNKSYSPFTITCLYNLVLGTSIRLHSNNYRDLSQKLKHSCSLFEAKVTISNVCKCNAFVYYNYFNRVWFSFLLTALIIGL